MSIDLKENLRSIHFKILVSLEKCWNVNFIWYLCFRRGNELIQPISFWKMSSGRKDWTVQGYFRHFNTVEKWKEVDQWIRLVEMVEMDLWFAMFRRRMNLLWFSENDVSELTLEVIVDTFRIQILIVSTA
jgi:hypothetical protein